MLGGKGMLIHKVSDEYRLTAGKSSCFMLPSVTNGRVFYLSSGGYLPLLKVSVVW